MKELTKGTPWKVIMLFAIPIICGNIFQQLYSIVDSKIVSNYVSTNAFAAIGATNIITNTIIAFINGTTQGFAIPVANSFGANDRSRMRRYIAGSIKLISAIGIFLLVAAKFFIEDILKALNTPVDIYEDALSYVNVILMGVIFTTVYNICANLLRAVGDSVTPLVCLLIAVGLNIGLDLLFVKVLNKGLVGAAYATIMAQAISALLCVGYILIYFRDLLPKSEEWKLESGQYKELISTGLAMGLMSCIVNVGTIVLQNAINKLGTVYVTAHTAARRLFDLLTVMLYSIGMAMTTYVSQNLGAGEPKRVKQGITQAIIIELGIAAVLFAICFIFGEPILAWITSTDDKRIVGAAVMYSRISISFFFILGPLFILRCSLQGMGRKVIPVVSSIMEMVIKIISASVIIPIYKYRGVAFTEPISWVSMTIVLTVAFIIFSKKDLTLAKEESNG